ncbi:MAG: hypothetical protein FWD34_02980 [Oscillospiraceae bacterium]|nr:hypothetical protein [Oscillospiraceae bacterium]
MRNLRSIRKIGEPVKFGVFSRTELMDEVDKKPKTSLMDVKSAAVTHNCPNCTAELKFNASTWDYDCIYCDSTFRRNQLR